MILSMLSMMLLKLDSSEAPLVSLSLSIRCSGVEVSFSRNADVHQNSTTFSIFHLFLFPIPYTSPRIQIYLETLDSRRAWAPREARGSPVEGEFKVARSPFREEIGWALGGGTVCS